jgi:flagellar protein FliO/FliZ
MTDTTLALAPAMGLLVLLVLLAWGVQWVKKRVTGNTQGGTQLRLVSQMAVGPQQRVVVVELATPQGAVHLTLGVTPGQVNTLYSHPVGQAAPQPTYTEVVQALQKPAPT